MVMLISGIVLLASLAVYAVKALLKSVSIDDFGFLVVIWISSGLFFVGSFLGYFIQEGSAREKEEKEMKRGW